MEAGFKQGVGKHGVLVTFGESGQRKPDVDLAALEQVQHPDLGETLYLVAKICRVEGALV